MDFSSFQCPSREHGNDDYHRVLVGSVYDTSMISLGVHAVEDLHIDVLVLEYTIPSVLSSYTYFFTKPQGSRSSSMLRSPSGSWLVSTVPHSWQINLGSSTKG